MVKKLLLAMGAALGLAAAAQAQIRIGQTAGFTGVVAGPVKEITSGATLYLDHVNAQGGVNGQQIELISMDDKYDAKLAAENARKLVTEKKVIALFLNRGTPPTEAVLPLLEEFKVPLIAPSTGAMVLHQPVKRWVYNVRTPYRREGEQALPLLSSMGMSRIGLMQVNDSFGNDGAAGALSGFAKSGLQPVFNEKFALAEPDFAPIVKKVVETQPQSIIFIGSTPAIAKFMPMIRAAGSRAQIISLSNNATSGFIKALGEHARGTIVTQVFPGERALAVPMVKELTDLAAKKGIAEISPAMLEGFAGAKVLVEGLRRAGKEPTPASLARALDGLVDFDLGGVKLTFGPNDHTGLDFADLSIVNAAGKFTR
jgi:branched-chain amino acid transport system substrate-binding protein